MTYKLIKSAFRDFFTRHLPNNSKEESFAFLVHPRDMRDVKRKYPFLAYLPETLSEHLLAYFFWPIVVSKITGVKSKSSGKIISGYVISIPMTAARMMNNRGVAKWQIKKATRLAEKLGAKNIGLGALTASLTKGGLDLVDKKIVASITNGKLYTAKTVTDIAMDATNSLNLNKEEVLVAVIGAAGSIGSASAQILAKKGYKKFLLIDLSDKNKRVDQISMLLKNLSTNIQVSSDTSLVKLIEADIIIAATNKPEALIRSENVKSGAVIVDDAQPSDVDQDIIDNRRDVLVLEGGVVNTPNIDVNFEMGLKYENDIFSCLAEVIILSHINSKEQRIGEVVEVNFDRLKELEEVSDELGFRHGKFQNASRTYSKNDIDYIIESKV